MIKSIEVENLRGISINAKLDLDDKSLIMYGENGKGKSSFIDGIELAITGDIKHISSNCKEITLTKHAPNISSKFSDIKAKIQFTDNSIISNCDEVCADTLAADIKRSMAGNVNILRRAQLLDAIYTQPKDRYDLLKPFLPLGKINKYEKALKDVIDKFEKESLNIKEEIIIYKINLKTILKITDINSVKGDNILQLLIQQSSELGINNLNKFDDIPEVSRSIDNELKKIEDTQSNSKYREVVHLLEQIKEKESPLILAKKIFDDINSRLSQKQKEKIVFYEEFLNIGIKWLEEENSSKCPFCESDINVNELIERIYQRKLQNSEYIQIKHKFESDYNNLNSNFDWWNNIADLIIDNNTEDISDTELTNLSDEIVDNLEEFKNAVPKSIEDNIVEKILPEWSSQIIDSVNKLLENYKKKLPSNDVMTKVTKLTDFKNRINSVYKNTSDIYNLIDKYNTIHKRYEIVNTFYTEVINQRKQGVQNIYDDIKEDINKFYSFMHEGEEIGNLDLKIKESTGKGSALIESSFYEKVEEDPRAYYSEAHLDTLGLAIFLALYKRECNNTKNLKFLVLDDVLTSVDAAHRSRVMTLLFTQFKGHQLIITTHDITLYNEILEMENQYGGNNKFKNIEICDWDIRNGPILNDSKSEFEKLQNLYDDARTDKDILASKAGTFLELILNKLRYSLNLSIPAQCKDKYTISDIWDNLHKVLTKNKGFYNRHSKIIDNINSTKFLRNTNGCHYNDWAQNISKDEIKIFARNVMDLYKVIYCKQCGTYIKRINNDDYACKCKNLNYIKNIIIKENVI